MNDSQLREFAFNEATYLIEEDNQYVIKGHKFFKSNYDEFCIVMDYAEGYTLRSIVTNWRGVFRNHKKFADKIYI